MLGRGRSLLTPVVKKKHTLQESADNDSGHRIFLLWTSWAVYIRWKYINLAAGTRALYNQLISTHTHPKSQTHTQTHTRTPVLPKPPTPWRRPGSGTANQAEFTQQIKCSGNQGAGNGCGRGQRHWGGGKEVRRCPTHSLTPFNTIDTQSTHPPSRLTVPSQLLLIDWFLVVTFPQAPKHALSGGKYTAKRECKIP